MRTDARDPTVSARQAGGAQPLGLAEQMTRTRVLSTSTAAAPSASDEEDPLATLEQLIRSGALSLNAVRELTSALAERQPDRAWFSVDAGLIDRLGRELVAKQETAVAELIKNAYDADANRVSVTFESVDVPGGRLTITDDGDGMTREQLLRGFMRISTTSKHGTDRSPGLGRPRAGQKGIGRFSAQRLGERLILTTTARGAHETLELDIPWDHFQAATDLGGVAVALRTVAAVPGAQGTTLEIQGLREAWTDAQIRRVYRYVLGLLRPTQKGVFTEADLVAAGIVPSPAQQHALAAPGVADEGRFEVTFLWDRGDDKEVKGLDDEAMFLDHAVAQFEVLVAPDAAAHLKFRAPRFEIEDTVVLARTEGREPESQGWAELAGKVLVRGHYFIHDASLVPKLFSSRVNELLTENGGFRIFRNGFRVLPYGTRGDDWAELDISTRQRAFLPAHANFNWLATIVLEDTSGSPAFVETASREGFIETEAFLALGRLVRATTRHVAGRVAEARGRKVRAGDRSKASPEERLKKTADRIRAQALREGGKASNPSTLAAWRALAEAADEVDEGTAEFVEERQQNLDELAALRILAALGLAVGEFTHEIRHLVAEIANHLDALAAAKARGQILGEAADLIVHLGAAMRGLQDQAGYFDRAIADRAQREVRAQDLRAVLTQFERVLAPRAKKQGIILEVLARGGLLWTAPMHEAEWMSVLLNLYTNAERAVRRAGGTRRVRFEAQGAASGGAVVLRCSDTGCGVAPNLRDRIFAPFFTTSSTEARAPDGTVVQGTGLGLHIVREILTARAGSVTLMAEAVDGFKTTFEVRIPAGAPVGGRS